jgi:AcrR family transcriptional regulator
MNDEAAERGAPNQKTRPARADAQRNLDALLEAAKAVFAESGVDAPVRDIAEKAGVGVATVYRHFPQRSLLIAAVFRREMDACVDLAPVLAATHEPAEALSLWLQRFAAFMTTKRGLAAALYSGDSVYEGLSAHFETRLIPAMRTLLTAAIDAGQIRDVVDPDELLGAVARLSVPVPAGSDKPGNTDRMVALLVDGLCHGAPSGKTPS